MAKKKRIKVESLNNANEPVTVYIKLPDSQDNKKAQLAYNKSFKEALQSGAVLRQKLVELWKSKFGMSTNKSSMNKILSEIQEGEKTLNRGGISLKPSLALKMAAKDLSLES